MIQTLQYQWDMNFEICSTKYSNNIQIYAQKTCFTLKEKLAP